jgi:hypothetical protein
LLANFGQRDRVQAVVNAYERGLVRPDAGQCRMRDNIWARIYHRER